MPNINKSEYYILFARLIAIESTMMVHFPLAFHDYKESVKELLEDMIQNGHLQVSEPVLALLHKNYGIDISSQPPSPGSSDEISFPPELWELLKGEA